MDRNVIQDVLDMWNSNTAGKSWISALFTYLPRAIADPKIAKKLWMLQYPPTVKIQFPKIYLYKLAISSANYIQVCLVYPQNEILLKNIAEVQDELQHTCLQPRPFYLLLLPVF